MKEAEKVHINAAKEKLIKTINQSNFDSSNDLSSTLQIQQDEFLR